MGDSWILLVVSGFGGSFWDVFRKCEFDPAENTQDTRDLLEINIAYNYLKYTHENTKQIPASNWQWTSGVTNLQNTHIF